MKPRATDRLLTAADLAGTFVFAVEGALTAVRADLDLLGIVVLAFVTAVGGGIMRDIILGERPPAAFRDWRYPAIALGATLATIAGAAAWGSVGGVQLPYGVQLLDAAGLALFAVAGTEKALDHQLNAASAIILGAMTGVGGGTLRDLLINQVPAVLRVDFYATAALAGAALMVVLVRLTPVPRGAAALVSGLGIFALRVAAMGWGWTLPHLR